MAKFTGYIGRAWSLYWANFLQIFLAMLLILAVSIISILIMGFVMELDPIIGVLLSVALLLVLMPFTASFYGMAAEAVKTGKTSLGTLFSTFKKKAVTLLGIQIASVIIAMLPLLVAIVIILGFSAVSSSLDPLSLSIAIVAALAAVALSILLLLAVPSAVCDNTGVIRSLKNSFAIVKASPGSLFAIWLIYTVLGAILSLIPLLGSVLTLIIIGPMMDIAITDFYMKNKVQKTKTTAKKPAKAAAKTKA
jgi:hypothetical protein